MEFQKTGEIRPATTENRTRVIAEGDLLGSIGDYLSLQGTSLVFEAPDARLLVLRII